MRTMIVLHHSADASTEPQYEKIYAYHNSGAGGKWPAGNGIQYHWVVGMDGTVREGKSENKVGWHSGNWLLNQISIGIVCCGDFTKNSPTSAQIVALEALLYERQVHHHIMDEAIVLHSAFRATSCPGTDLRNLALLQRKKIATVRELIDEPSPTKLRMLNRRLARIVRWMGGA